VDRWVALLAEDVHMRSVADGAAGMEFSAPWKGLEAARGYFSALSADREMIYHRADRFLVDGDHVVVFGACSWRYRPTVKTVETPIVQHWQFRDGLAVEYFDKDTALMGALKGGGKPRALIISEIGKLGADAKAALPLLMQLKTDPEEAVRNAVAEAIKAIKE
jgi:ketosteroid isomerase-like protein